MTLLGKWCWRMLVNRDGLWYMVLVDRYSEEDGFLKDGGQRSFIWWREISRVCDGGEGGSEEVGFEIVLLKLWGMGEICSFGLTRG